MVMLLERPKHEQNEQDGKPPPTERPSCRGLRIDMVAGGASIAIEPAHGIDGSSAASSNTRHV